VSKTYATLQTAIADYLNRADLTLPIQDAIDIAQRKLERDNDWKCMRATKTGNLTADSADLDYPTRYKNTFALYILGTDNAYNRLNQNPLPWGHIAYPYMSSDTGLPELFAEDDATSHVVLRPTPDTTYTYVWYYNNFLESISTATTSWWLTNAWELILYGSLIEMMPYIMNDERLVIWQTLYDKSVSSLKMREEKAELSGSDQYIKVPLTLV
jgi:hypothetical protein